MDFLGNPIKINTAVRYHLTTVRWLVSKKLEILSLGKDVEKREHLCTVGGNINWFSH